MGASFYKGHLREPVTLTHIVEGFEVELSLSVSNLGLWQLGFEDPDPLR